MNRIQLSIRSNIHALLCVSFVGGVLQYDHTRSAYIIMASFPPPRDSVVSEIILWFTVKTV